MATRRCCCGGACPTYADGFQRTGNDETLLEPDWEVCGSWTDWEINPTSPAFTGIVSRSSSSRMVLVGVDGEHMAGNPFGILEAKIEADTVGQKYRIYIYHGTESVPCSGTNNTYAEIEVTDTNEITQRLVIGGSEEFAENYIITSTEVDWRVCVTDKLIESFVSGGVTQQYCGTPSGYYFAIGVGSSTVTKWSEVRYSDHYLHNTACPKCARSCCFPTVDRTIAGFRVTISNIADGDCTCQTSIGPIDVPLLTGVGLSGICSCSPVFETTITGPHDCSNPGFVSSNIALSFVCNETTNEKGLSVSILPDDGDATIAYIWEKAFGSSALPEDIRIDNDPDTESSGDVASCLFSGATITVTPIVVGGCCDEIPTEVAFLMETSATERKSQDSRLISWVTMFRAPEDTGVGDTVERLLSKAGGRAIKRMLERVGVNCGCTNRQRWLNRNYPY